MEKRAVLAIAISAAILILYQMFFVPPPPPRPETPKSSASKESPGGKLSDASPPIPPSPPSAVVSQGIPVPVREVRVDTPRFLASVTTAGGRIVDWVMKYRGQRSVIPKGSPPPFSLRFRRPGQPELFEVPFEAQTGDLVLTSTHKEGVIRLEGTDQYQLVIAIEFRFTDEDDRAKITVFLENKHRVPQQVELMAEWAVPPPSPSTSDSGDMAVRFTRVVGVTPSGLVRQPTTSLSNRKMTEGVHWIAVESDDHYLAALIPQTPNVGSVEDGGGARPTEIGLVFAPLTLAPGGKAEVGLTLYVGPKEYDRLRKMGVGLEKTVDFGTFLWILPMEWFSVPLLWLMNIIYRFTGNYGVAIILLTVLTKVLFYPLTQKSMTSMKQMQALQPQLNALRAKYKNDNQRLQRETMELYRKHGVNPMGGCLPILIQIPIFYALYVTLTVSVELQQSPLLCLGQFFGHEVWICDLSKKDPTYVLPLLMGASMFVQQKMTPTVGDPRQARIMLFMPIVFTYTFLWAPAGLVLYWLMNNVLSIAQQFYANRPSQGRKTLGKEEDRRSRETKNG